MSVCSVIPHWADRFAEEGTSGPSPAATTSTLQPFLFVLYAVPVALAAYLGAPAVEAALGWIAQHAIWVMNGLFVASGMLAALGIALNLKFLFRGNTWPYFFIGFAVTSLMAGKVNLVVLAIIGACVAYIHVLFTAREGEEQPTPPAERRAGPGLLTRRDVFRAWLRWLFFSHSCYNWERMRGLGFAHNMAPHR